MSVTQFLTVKKKSLFVIRFPSIVPVQHIFGNLVPS